MGALTYPIVSQWEFDALAGTRRLYGAENWPYAVAEMAGREGPHARW